MAASINNRNYNLIPISLNQNFCREQLSQKINDKISVIDKEIKVTEQFVESNKKIKNTTEQLISSQKKSIDLNKESLDASKKLLEGGEKLIKLHQEQKENLNKRIDLYKKLVNNLDNTSAEIVASGERAKAEILAFGERSQAKFQALLDRKGKRSNNTELTTTTHKLEESKNSIIPSTQKVLDTSTSGKPNPTYNEINDRLAAIRAKRLNKPDTLNTVVSVNNRNNTKEVSVALPENKTSVSVGTQTDNTVAVVTPKKTVTAIDQGTQTENKLSKQEITDLTKEADRLAIKGDYKEAQKKYDKILKSYGNDDKGVSKDYRPLDEQLRLAGKLYIKIKRVQEATKAEMPVLLEASIVAAHVSKHISFGRMQALHMIENMFYYPEEPKEDKNTLPKGSLIKEQSAQMEDRIKKHEIAIDYQNQQIAKMSNSDQAKNATTTSIPSRTEGLANSYRPSSNLVHDLRTDNKQEKENSVVSTLSSQQYKYIVQSQTNIWESIVAANVRKSV